MRIEVSDVAKRFGRLAALDGVSFEIAPRSRLALVGPNGSGKSTLNRILMGLLAHEGRVRLDGACPFRERVRVAQRTAYVPQAAPQLAAPVGEVLAAIATVRGLEPARIERLAGSFDLDLAALAHRPFRALSGGTKQKLLIAIAFAADASLLILDEPTGSLDAHSRERFFELFDACAPQATLILCSHRLDEIRPLVDQVLLLHEGRVAHHGPASEFLERRALSAIDAWAEGEDAAAWLAARGFRKSPSGAWRRLANQTEKLALLAEMSQVLGPRLRNVNARDLEAVDVAPERRP